MLEGPIWIVAEREMITLFESMAVVGRGLISAVLAFGDFGRRRWKAISKRVVGRPPALMETWVSCFLIASRRLVLGCRCSIEER